MSTKISRRTFFKTSGTAAGVATVGGLSSCSSAQNDKIRLGIIGTGAQAQLAHIGQGLRVHQDKIQIVAICDVWNLNLNKAAKKITETIDDAKFNTYNEYKDMLDKEQLDAVLIATPLVTHFNIVMDCLDADLYVFCEKTMTMTIEESRKIVEKCQEKGKFLQVGHQRRYNPYYNKAMWLAKDKNLIGRITHMNAQWHRNDSWRRAVPKDYQMTALEKQYIPDLEKHVNWRLYNDMSAGLMTELGTHQLDVASWFLGSTPTKVSGMGSIEYWKDNRDAEDHVALIYEWIVKPGDSGFIRIAPRNREQDKIQLNRAYKVRLSYSSICTNSKLHYSELIQGEYGALELVGEQKCQFYAEKWWMEYKAKLKEKQLREEAAARGEKIAEDAEVETESSMDPGALKNEGIPIHVYTDENKGTEYNVWMANHNQWAGFANDIKTGGMPYANQMAGLSSAICGHKGNEALRTGKTIEISPDLMKFAFETPDPYGHYEVDGPKPGEGPKKEDEEATTEASTETGA